MKELARQLLFVAKDLASRSRTAANFTVTHQPHAAKPYHVECVVIPPFAWHESQYRTYRWDVSYEEGDAKWSRFAEAASRAVRTGRKQKFIGDL